MRLAAFWSVGIRIIYIPLNSSGSCLATAESKWKGMWRAKVLLRIKVPRVCSGVRGRQLATNAALAMGVTTWSAGVLTHARGKHQHWWSLFFSRECYVMCLEKTTCPAHMRQVIVDTDCSLDCFAAIALLFKSDVDVVLVTTNPTSK